MLEGLNNFPLAGLITLGAILLLGILWLAMSFFNKENNWQQIFCPEDRSTCFCRSCREERGSNE